tara:strand:- start:457 stop:792 length:336 start_codon:yes stop_codon:yes gene_type:complete
MANVERLTKRVKKIEEWIGENGDGPTLDNLNFLLQAYRGMDEQMRGTQHQLAMLQSLIGEYLGGKELSEDWDEWLKEKDNAVQKQQAEEVSVQEQAQSSEEVSETSKEEEE